MIKLKLWLQWATMSAIGWVIGWMATLLIELFLLRYLKYLILLIVGDSEASSNFREVMLENIGDGIPGQFIGVQSAFIYGGFFGALQGAVFGMIGGSSQVLFLRHYITKAYWWILVSVLAWTFYWGVVWGHAWAWGWTEITILICSFDSKIPYGLFGTIGLGVFQWLVLRKQIPKAYSWIFMVVLSWFILRFIAEEITRIMGAGTFPMNWAWVIAGSLHGVVTGGALVWLLSPTKRSSSTS
jgi:hypothetical protein